MGDRDRTVRAALERFGVFPDVAVQQMFIAPNTTDPDMQATIAVVGGAQRALNELGFDLVENGILNARTAGALDRVIGTGWQFRPWLQVYNDLERAIRLRPALRRATDGLGDVTPTQSGLGTAALLGLATLGYLLFVRRS
jgi:hypothetical protein